MRRTGRGLSERRCMVEKEIVENSIRGEIQNDSFYEGG
jgi:hypothetical protein